MDIPVLVERNLAIQFNRDHPCHQANANTTADTSGLQLRPHVRGRPEKLPGLDAQAQGQSHGIVGITTRLDGGLRLGVPRRCHAVSSFLMPTQLESDDPNLTKWVRMVSRAA